VPAAALQLWPNCSHRTLHNHEKPIVSETLYCLPASRLLENRRKILIVIVPRPTCLSSLARAAARLVGKMECEGGPANESFLLKAVQPFQWNFLVRKSIY